MRLLVAEGNKAVDRQRIASSVGEAYAESYAKVLRFLAPDAQIEVFTPADSAARPPRDLDAYDGLAITGSSLSIYKCDEESLRQVDVVRELFARGIPSSPVNSPGKSSIKR